MANPNLNPTDAELTTWARTVIREHGIAGAVRRTGLPRDPLLSVAAGADLRSTTRLAAAAAFARETPEQEAPH